MILFWPALLAALGKAGAAAATAAGSAGAKLVAAGPAVAKAAGAAGATSPALGLGAAVPAGIGTGTAAGTLFGSASQGLGTTLGQVAQGAGQAAKSMGAGLKQMGAGQVVKMGAGLIGSGGKRKKTAPEVELAPVASGDPITAALQQQAEQPMDLNQRRQMLMQQRLERVFGRRFP